MPPEKRKRFRLAATFFILGAAVSLVWAVAEMISMEVPEGLGDPAVYEKNISYTLIPFAIGIILTAIVSVLAPSRPSKSQ